MSDLYTDTYHDTYGGGMALRRMWDAAFPPTSPPKWEVVAFYIGGNTPHVWTETEIARQAARYRLPIFVRSHDGDPLADAHSSIVWLVSHEVPRGVTLALDYETRVDAIYLAAFDRAVLDAGWRVMVYGSRDFVLRNPKPSGGYWVADYTGSPHLYPGSAATQWSGSEPFGGAYDPNLVADSTPLWDTGKDDMTTEEHDALMWLRANVTSLRDQGVRMTDHGDPNVMGRSNHLAQVRADIAALQADVDALKQALAAGLQLDPAQLDQIKAAASLEGTALVQLAVSPAVP
jgi:hypothetical protein